MVPSPSPTKFSVGPTTHMLLTPCATQPADEEPPISCSSLAFGDSQWAPSLRQPAPARVWRWRKKCVTFVSSFQTLYHGAEIVSSVGGCQYRREPSKRYSYWMVGSSCLTRPSVPTVISPITPNAAAP